jgi:hypothetical protein
MNLYVVNMITKALDILFNVFPTLRIPYRDKNNETGKSASKK